MGIRQAKAGQWREAAAMALRLWPSHEQEELEREVQQLLQNPDAAVFLLYDQNVPAGFAQCGIRRDYVEGSSGSPVGYLEGIFVTPEYRRRGFAKALLRECERWCRQKGCLEMGSDCALENRESQQFHLSGGFSEAGRIICFIKNLGE